MITTSDLIQFELPDHLACPKPTEERNTSRDDVRLLVTSGEGMSEHAHFSEIPNYLQPGDVMVVNTSATQPAAFPVSLPGNRQGRLHLSTRINDGEWLVEIREVVGTGTVRWREGIKGMVLPLPSEAFVKLTAQYYGERELLHLWVAEFKTDLEVETYIQQYGQPIKYEGLDKPYPLDYYQTFFSIHPGSSEMPSAGRGFTQAVVDELLSRGVVFAPILLHTGISSLEENEAPYPEYMEVDSVTASVINHARKNSKRVVAVGTTAVRAVESATNDQGDVIPQKGQTQLYIESGHEMKTIDGLLTGFHEPKASHLHMLQSLAGFEHIDRAYKAAIEHKYYWHQFGDLHLIL